MARANATPEEIIMENVRDAKLYSLIGAAMAVLGKREEEESIEEYNALIGDIALDIIDASSSDSARDISLILSPTARTFPATILNVERDPQKEGVPWSTRMAITLEAKSTRGNGTEVIRTERTDGYDGSGKRVAQTAFELVGWEVLIYADKDGEDGKFRVLRHISPLRESEDIDKIRRNSKGYQQFASRNK